MRVHLGHILTAVGLNMLPLGARWLEIAHTKTHITPFARLLMGAAAV
jgi:hypothetical protein